MDQDNQGSTPANDQASQPNPFEEQDKEGMFSPATDTPRLEEDNDTPAAKPDDVAEPLPDTHQQTDTNLQPEEIYDEGISGATDADAQHEEEDGDDPVDRIG